MGLRGGAGFSSSPHRKLADNRKGGGSSQGFLAVTCLVALGSKGWEGNS